MGLEVEVERERMANTRVDDETRLKVSGPIAVLLGHCEKAHRVTLGANDESDLKSSAESLTLWAIEVAHLRSVFRVHLAGSLQHCLVLLAASSTLAPVFSFGRGTYVAHIANWPSLTPSRNMMIFAGSALAFFWNVIKCCLTMSFRSVMDSLRPSWMRISGQKRLLSPEMEAIVTAIEGAI